MKHRHPDRAGSKPDPLLNIRTSLLAGGIVVSGLACMAYLLVTWERPVLPALIVGVVAFSGAFFSTRGSSWSALWFNFAFVFLVLAVVEGAMGMKEKRFVGAGCGGESHTRHADLGFVITPGRQFHCKKFHKDNLVYEITYTVEPNGLRISPPRAENPTACVVFVGGSFTFGAGVADEETFAYRVGESSRGKIWTYNFGVEGFGTHQVLAALEGGFVAERIDCVPSHIIYLAIFDHTLRAAGVASWGLRGPRYVLGDDGRIVRDGQFADHRSIIGNGIFEIAARSAIGRKFLRRHVPASDEDLALFVALVTRTRDFTLGQFPGAEFHMLYWEIGDESSGRLAEEVEEAGIPVHFMSRALNDPGGKNSIYRVHRYDGHPNALAHERIAKYIREEILD